MAPYCKPIQQLALKTSLISKLNSLKPKVSPLEEQLKKVVAMLIPGKTWVTPRGSRRIYLIKSPLIPLFQRRGLNSYASYCLMITAVKRRCDKVSTTCRALVFWLTGCHGLAFYKTLILSLS